MGANRLRIESAALEDQPHGRCQQLPAPRTTYRCHNRPRRDLGPPRRRNGDAGRSTNGCAQWVAVDRRTEDPSEEGRLFRLDPPPAALLAPTSGVQTPYMSARARSSSSARALMVVNETVSQGSILTRAPPRSAASTSSAAMTPRWVGLRLDCQGRKRHTSAPGGRHTEAPGPDRNRFRRQPDSPRRLTLDGGLS